MIALNAGKWTVVSQMGIRDMPDGARHGQRRNEHHHGAVPANGVAGNGCARESAGERRLPMRASAGG